jgi:superfamily II DNA or RNA helicase
VKDFVAEYGHIVVDECHHLSAFTFEKVMREVKARYVVGLTATPARKDGHHPIIFMQCGPIRYRMNARTMTDSTPFEVRRPLPIFSSSTRSGNFSTKAGVAIRNLSTHGRDLSDPELFPRDVPLL